MKQTEMYVEGYKAKLHKDTSRKGLWVVSFILKEFKNMQHKCKITVLETKVFSDLQEKYLADPKSGACPCFKVGDTFTLERNSERDDFYHLMNGKFCGEAWDAI